jgi:hypothetical protein
LPLDTLFIHGYILVQPIKDKEVRYIIMKKLGCCIISFLFAVIIFGFLLNAAPARAKTTQCEAIKSLPVTINRKGVYCLTEDFETNLNSGAAIKITANNVTIDLNGYKIENHAAGTTASGIYAFRKKNITIRNGTIRGFYVGIWLKDSSTGHRIENIRTDGNTWDITVF